MPELPEVESYRIKLASLVVGREVLGVKVAKNNYAFVTPPKRIADRLKGASIDALDRRGKYLLLRIRDRGTLLIHLGMTGQIFSRRYDPDKHVHITLTLKGLKHLLYFRDPRKFGKLLWIESGKEGDETRLAKLGPDALQITGDGLYSSLRKRSAPVKALLLNQSILAGVGNIYADEALFRTGIRPTRAGKRISRQNVESLAESIRAVLIRAIERGGSSINDYIHPDGSLGYFQVEHQVYGREGEPCERCGAKVKRIVVAQRSSHYCPRCQR